jgi:virulence surface antigen
MQIREVENLNLRHQVEAKSFTQDRFRRKNGLDPRMGLCAGLVQLWWAGLRQNQNTLDLLRNATPGLVNQVVDRQARSFYFGELPNAAEMDDETIFWLKFKYGKPNTREVQLLCRQHEVKELHELDLILEHEAPIVERRAFPCFSPELLDALTVPADSGLRLLLLRYQAPGRKSGQSGHRVALAVNPNGSCRFFDPNCGEMTFPDLRRFRAWFADFWPISDYNSLIEQPVPGTPALRLYRFGCAFEAEPQDSGTHIGALR